MNWKWKSKYKKTPFVIATDIFLQISTWITIETWLNLFRKKKPRDKNRRDTWNTYKKAIITRFLKNRSNLFNGFLINWVIWIICMGIFFLRYKLIFQSEYKYMVAFLQVIFLRLKYKAFFWAKHFLGNIWTGIVWSIVSVRTLSIHTFFSEL